METQENNKQTKKQLFLEIIRFLIVGGVATIVDYITAYLFYHFFLPPTLIGKTWSLIVSTALGFCVGLAVNWLLSVSFVFKQVKDKKKSSSATSFIKFAIIGILGLVLTEIGMLLFVKCLPSFSLFGSATFLGEEWKWWTGKVIMTLIVLAFNYLGRKIFIFK